MDPGMCHCLGQRIAKFVRRNVDRAKRVRIWSCLIIYKLIIVSLCQSQRPAAWIHNSKPKTWSLRTHSLHVVSCRSRRKNVNLSKDTLPQIQKALALSTSSSSPSSWTSTSLHVTLYRRWLLSKFAYQRCEVAHCTQRISLRSWSFCSRLLLHVGVKRTTKALAVSCRSRVQSQWVGVCVWSIDEYK